MAQGRIPVPPEAPLDTRLWTVRAYILAFLPNLVMTREEHGARTLIGGEVPVDCYFEGYPRANPELIARLADYTYTQTGLHLLGLFPAIAVDFFTNADGFSVTMTFLATAHGQPDRGIRVTPETLPELPAVCGRAAEHLAKHQALFSEEALAPLLAPREPLTGVFKTTRPFRLGQGGPPLHYLLRFYPDGLVLQAAIAARNTAALEAWRDWLQRERRDDRLARGHYQFDRGVLGFTTVSRAPGGRAIVADHDGTRWGERLWITEAIRGYSGPREHAFAAVPETPSQRVRPRLRWPWQKPDGDAD